MLRRNWRHERSSLTNSPYTVLASLTLVVTQPPTHTPTPTSTNTPTPTNTPVPPCSGSVTVSDSSIEVRERVDVDASYSGDCPSGASLEWSRQLSTSSRCGPNVPRTANTDLSRRLYGCVAGTGTVWLIDDSNNDTLDSVRVTVRARPTATPTPTPTTTSTPSPTSTPTLVPPRITGSSLSGTRLRVNYARPSGTSYYKFSIYRSYYGENDFNEYDDETDRSSPVYFYGLPRGYTYYVRGQSCRDGSYSDCDGLGNRSATRTVPTVTPTPTPTRTPVPSTGSLSASRSSIRVGQSTRITARYTLGTGATEARLSYTSHVSVDSSCPGRSDTREHVLPRNARDVDRYDLYGCTAGTATVKLLEIPSRDVLARLTITVTAPPTATPTRTPTPTATPVPGCCSEAHKSDLQRRRHVALLQMARSERIQHLPGHPRRR